MKTYIILWAQKDSIQGMFNVSEIQFVFTSKKMAEEQMNNIKYLIENGGWWTDLYGQELKGRILSDDIITNCFMYEYQRDMVYESPNGTTCLYRLICFNKVNQGYLKL